MALQVIEVAVARCATVHHAWIVAPAVTRQLGARGLAIAVTLDRLLTHLLRLWSAAFLNVDFARIVCHAVEHVSLAVPPVGGPNIWRVVMVVRVVAVDIERALDCNIPA